MREFKTVLGAMALAFVCAAPAVAQSYPGTTSTTLAPTTQNIGVLAVGQETTILSGGFAPGAVTVAVNGQGGASDTAAANGVVSTTVAVLGVSLMRVEGVQFPANCGGNTVAVTGSVATGGTRTVNTSFDIACAATADASGLLPRTGGAILGWSLAGIALVALGSLLVVSNRRRRTSSPTAS